MSVKTIYGMAKSFLNLRGAKARSLELDFVRLGWVTEKDEDCIGVYLCAPLNPLLAAQTISGWNRKYHFKREVEFVPVQLTEEEELMLLREKDRNRLGNLRKGGEDAFAHSGRDLVEEKLTMWIRRTHNLAPDAPILRGPELPEIRWDFFATLPV